MNANSNIRESFKKWQTYNVIWKAGSTVSFASAKADFQAYTGCTISDEALTHFLNEYDVTVENGSIFGMMLI